MEAQAERPVVLILDLVETRRLRHAGYGLDEHNRPARCRLQLAVKDIEADVEPRRDVPLGAGAEAPPIEVVVAGEDARGARSREADYPAPGTGERRWRLRRADRSVRGVIVANGHIAAVERSPQVRPPEVLVGGLDADSRRQLDISGGRAHHAVREEAVAEVVAVEHKRAEGARLREEGIAQGTLRVVALDLEVVAAEGVDLGACASRPTQLVGRMTARFGPRQSSCAGKAGET